MAERARVAGDLARAMQGATAWLHTHAAELKARDPQEPRRAAKLRAEAQLREALQAYFAQQARVVRMALAGSERAAGTDALLQAILTALGPLETEAAAALLRVLGQAARDGVSLFGEMVRLELDWSLVNSEAAEWARRYAYTLVRAIDDVTRAALRQAVAAFIETPGMTLADVAAALPLAGPRAELVAVTEVTRAYAEGQKLAGERMAAQFPDVAVRKRWFTNRDDRVCPICAPLHNQEVDRQAKFSSAGIALELPPAHPRCRCWIDYRTRING